MSDSKFNPLSNQEQSMRILLSVLLLAATSFTHAGNLAPSVGPNPTFRTLTEIEPRVAIRRTTSPAPLVIDESGSYYLTADVSSLGQGGIRIDADNVQLDLNGFSISEGSIIQGGAGITINGTDITVRNGFVHDNDGAGIVCAPGNRNVRLIDMVVTDNGGPGVDCTSLQVENGDYSRNTGDGIACGPCNIVGARVVANSGDGIHDAFSRGVIRDVIARSNGGNGIDCPFNEKTLVNTSVVSSNTGTNMTSGCIGVGTVTTP
jgi:hypothetical protein